MFSVGDSSSVMADVGAHTRIMFLSVDLIANPADNKYYVIVGTYDLPYIFALSLAHVIHNRPIREYDKEARRGESRMRKFLHYDSQ